MPGYNDDSVMASDVKSVDFQLSNKSAITHALLRSFQQSNYGGTYLSDKFPFIGYLITTKFHSLG